MGREPLLAVPATSTKPPTSHAASTTPPRTAAPHHTKPASNQRPPQPSSQLKTQPSGRTLLWIKDGLSGIRFLIDTGSTQSPAAPHCIWGNWATSIRHRGCQRHTHCNIRDGDAPPSPITPTHFPVALPGGRCGPTNPGSGFPELPRPIGRYEETPAATSTYPNISPR